MTVKELRALVDNFDEYIHIPGGIDRLKRTVLHLAVSGQLVPQDLSEGTGEELYQQIQAEKAQLIKEGKLKKQNLLPEMTEDEIPFEVPRTWKWARLADIYNVRDGTHDTPKYIEHGYPLVTSKNLSSGQLDLSVIKYISESDHLKIKERSGVSENDVLFAMIGSIGNPIIVNTTKEFSIKNVALFKPYDSKLYEPAWLLNYLNVAAGDMKKRSAGGVQSFVSLGFIRNYPMPLPPFAEQMRIVKKVGIIFELIDELAKRYHAEQMERKKLVVSSFAQMSRREPRVALEYLSQIIRTKADAAELRKTILHLAVSGQLVPQDPSEGTGEELYQQIQAEKANLINENKLKRQKSFPEITSDEIPFEIPRAWKWVRIRDIGYALGQKKPNKIFFYIDVASVDNQNAKLSEQLPLVTPKDAPSRARKLVDDGTVIYSTVRPYLLNTAIVKNNDNRELIASTAFAIVHPYEGVQSNWILFNFLAPYFVDYVNSKSVGAAYPAINDAAFDRSIIPLSPPAEQNRVIQKTSQLLGLVTQLEQHLEK